MEGNDLIKKGVVFAVILLFMGVAFAPSINANVDRRLPKAVTNFGMNRVKVTVTEFKPDGSREATVVEITREQVNTLRNELKGAKDLDERLSVLKDYDLVPQHVTIEQFKVGMEEKAQRMVFTEDKIARSLFQDERHFKINFNCYVFGNVLSGFKVLLGLSLLTRIINWIVPLVPSCDLLQLHVAFGMQVETKNGTLPSFWAGGYYGRATIVGFVGYYVSIIPPFIPLSSLLTFWEMFVGSAVYVGVHWSTPKEP